jgi:lysozyme
MPKSLSVNGAHFIKNAEGCRLKMYYCAAGKQTIGYGHVLRQGEPRFIDQGQADAYFDHDITWAVAALNETSGSDLLTQNQYDALVSFIFNIGAGAWRGSTARRDLTEGKIADIPAQMRRWVHDDRGRTILGLVNRRNQEISLWSKG